MKASWSDFREHFVVRYVNFLTWPANQRTALLSGFVIPAHLFSLVVIQYYLGDRDDLIHFRTYDPATIVITGVLIAFFFFCLAMIRLNPRISWTPYVLVVIYGSWDLYLWQQFGTLSNPFIAQFPIMVVCVTILLGPEVGIASILFGFIGIGVIALLELMELIPYAPIFSNPSIHAQLDPDWMSMVQLMLLTTFAFIFVLVQLNLELRKARTHRLKEMENQLHRSAKRLEGSNALIRRYAPRSVGDLILAESTLWDEEPGRKVVTILVVDLESSSLLAERLEADRLVFIMNQFFSEMFTLAEQYTGTVSESRGDGFVVLFGTPKESDGFGASAAVDAAFAMQRKMNDLCKQWRSLPFDFSLRLRIGVHTGKVCVGNFGSERRKVYAAIGSNAEIALLLEEQCAPGQIYISGATRFLLGKQVECEQVSPLRTGEGYDTTDVYRVISKDIQRQSVG